MQLRVDVHQTLGYHALRACVALAAYVPRPCVSLAVVAHRVCDDLRPCGAARPCDANLVHVSVELAVAHDGGRRKLVPGAERRRDSLCADAGCRKDHRWKYCARGVRGFGLDLEVLVRMMAAAVGTKSVAAVVRLACQFDVGLAAEQEVRSSVALLVVE